MGYELTVNLTEQAVAEHRLEAERNGRSLEAEIAALIERERPMRAKDPLALGELAKRLRAMTPPDGPDWIDSTLGIRWDRDTGHGRDLDDGWTDPDAGR